MACYFVASVPKSGLVDASSSLPVEKINSFAYFASLCVIICLPEEGSLLCLLSTIDPSAEQWQAPMTGPAPQEGMQAKQMSWHGPLSCLWQLKVGIFLAIPFSVLSWSPLFSHNHIFTLSSSLSDFPTLWWLLKLGGLTYIGN